MLFLESKTLSKAVEGTGRINLLEELQQKGLTSLIRNARLNCFDHLSLGAGRISEVETLIATWTESENQEPYVTGDVFCLSDHVFFLIFDDNRGVDPLVRAGIVYETRTPEPFRKLDSFCRDVRELLLAQTKVQEGETGTIENSPQWEQGKPTMPEGFKRFVAKQDADSLFTSLRKDTMSKRILAASKLENESARLFLRSVRKAHDEGYAAKLLSGARAEESHEFSIEKLEDVGLVEREVQISCRKTGHALFRLPNAHALAVVTISDATCSECGLPVADEKVEEVIAPTRLASSLLEDGSWLLSRLHSILREMGVPESEIAVGPSEGSGHGQMMVNLSGESFLIVTRDGDLTPAFARWAIDLEIDTEASHLVVVATGRLHNEAGVLLHNHARRRVSGGEDFELVVADDVAAAGKELRDALQRVSQRVIAEQVCDLDNSLGLSMSRLIITKFNLLPTAEELDREPLSTENAQSVPLLKPPLTLAAGASTGAGEILDIGAVPQESSENAQAERAENIETQQNPGTSWNQDFK